MKCHRLSTVIATIVVFASSPASSFAVASDGTSTQSSDERSVPRSDAPINILMDAATGQVLNATGTTPGQRSLRRSEAPRNLRMDTATGQVLNVTGTTPAQRCQNNFR